jgi:hypothetical protein
LNSVTLESPISLTFSLLDQLSALGDTAKQLKTVLKNSNPRRKEPLPDVLRIAAKTK